jgi:hypothetical protein
VVRFVQAARPGFYKVVTGVAETIDWASAVRARRPLADAQMVGDTLGALLKSPGRHRADAGCRARQILKEATSRE